MAKASKTGGASTQKVAPDSGAQAGYFIDPSTLAALLGGATGQDVEDFSLLLVQRPEENSAPHLASIPVDQNLLMELLSGATVSSVEGPSAGGGNADGHGCDHGSLMVIDGSAGIPFLPLFFEGPMPVPVPLDQEIVERVDCLMPELLEDLAGIFATTDDRDSLLLLILPPTRDLPPPPQVTDFG